MNELNPMQEKILVCINDLKKEIRETDCKVTLAELNKKLKKYAKDIIKAEEDWLDFTGGAEEDDKKPRLKAREGWRSPSFGAWARD